MKLYPDIKRNVPIHKFVDYLGADLTLKSCMTVEVAIGCLLKAYEHRAARFVKFNRNKLDKFIFKRVYCISTFSQDLHNESTETVRRLLELIVDRIPFQYPFIIILHFENINLKYFTSAGLFIMCIHIVFFGSFS